MTLQDANKAIKDAWLAGLISILVTITLTLVYASGAGFAHVALWNWVDIILLAGLSYGIYRKSSLAASLMLVYYLGSKIILWADERAFIGLPMALIFAYFFWRGVQGTRAYHQYSVSSNQ